MQDKREVWHVAGSKKVNEQSKEGEVVVALVPTWSAVCVDSDGISKRHSHVRSTLKSEVLDSSHMARVMPASSPLTRECLNVFRGSP
jgi:hypothetical protein